MEDSLSLKISLINLSLITTLFCGRPSSVNAQDYPADPFQKALFCFNNRLLYARCNEAYRLNESGRIRVPSEETGPFCHGPCLAETELVLKCVDKIMSDFVFYNKATTRDVRTALHVGCGSSDERGIFDVERYIGEDFIGKAGKSSNWNSLCVYALLVACGFLML